MGIYPVSVVALFHGSLITGETTGLSFRIVRSLFMQGQGTYSLILSSFVYGFEIDFTYIVGKKPRKVQMTGKL